MRDSDLVDRLMKEIYECYKISEKNHTSCCTTNSQLLYLALKNKGHKPRIWRYLNSEDQDNRVTIKLISGEEFISHVVILLEEEILDSYLPQKMPKEEYDRKLKEINGKIIVIDRDYTEKYQPKSRNDLEKICDECELSPLFTEALENQLPREWLEKN